MQRLLQLLLFCLTFLIFIFLYSQFGELRLDESFRYFIDVAMNTGTGSSNIVEKDDLTSLITTCAMLLGYFFNLFFWYDFIAFVVGKRDAMNSDFCKSFLDTCDRNIESMQLYTMTILYLILGILIGVYMEGFTFLIALNFAIGLLTTTGSQEPKNEAINNVVTGTYLLIGVPLFAFTMARFLSSLQRESYEALDREDL